MATHVCLVVSLVIIYGSLTSHSHHEIPGLKYEVYEKHGDINIGFLTRVHKYGNTEFCSSDIWFTAVLQVTEIAAYMTELINNDDDLLPNITLGFAAFDDCSKDLTALGRSTYFISTGSNADGRRKRKHHDVVGIVGPNTSRQVVMVASLLGLFQLPVLSPYATSDELSDKGRFPYFMRLVPPDEFQAVAIVDVIDYFGWTYVSMLYSEGSFGENAAKQIVRLTESRGICLAVSQMLASDASGEEMTSIIDQLYGQRSARAVILFLEPNSLHLLFGNNTNSHKLSYFTWLSGDTFPSARGSLMEQKAVGALFIAHAVGQMPGFGQYMKRQSWLNSTNPWLPLIFQGIYGCNWDAGNQDQRNDSEPCARYTTLQDADVNQFISPTKYADGFLVYAKALHSLIADHCPEHFTKSDHKHIRDCIDGALLLQYMYNTSFPGYLGQVTFDQKGDMQGNYTIQHYRWNTQRGYYAVPVGEWKRMKNALTFNITALDWGPSKDLARRSVKSVCSHPCRTGEYYKRKDVSCCWVCVACRNNEITINDNTDCQPCPNFTWPDSATRSFCNAIPPFYLESSSPIGTTLLCLSIMGMVVAVTLIIVYISQHEHPVILATSQELSIFMLAGCIMACGTSMLYIASPSNLRCIIRQAGFHLSVCVLYSPLLAKASRVYRISSAGKIGADRPGYTSIKAQLMFAAMIIMIQFATVCILEGTYSSHSTLTMPFPYERYVEITCYVCLESFIPPLTINLIVMVLCATYGYLTKNLPEQFKDSRNIFVSIFTTLFIWCVFLPTYFTIFHSHHKALLLSVCLLLNVYITIICQFGPKIYVIFFLSDDQAAYSVRVVTTESRVAPVPDSQSRT